MPFNHNPVDLGYQELLCETGESGRKYLSPQGKAYPSITTVLSILSADHIREWRKAVGNEEANRVSRVAAGRGTTVHALVEKFLNNEELDLSKEMPNASVAFKSIRGILENRVNNIRLQEKPLYSEHLGVAGRVDLVAEFASVAFKSIRGILENRVNNIRLQEKPLYSDHLGVAGRVDLVAEFDGKLARSCLWGIQIYPRNSGEPSQQYPAPGETSVFRSSRSCRARRSRGRV